ncbi:hypothetical protein BDV41DRAFT_540865 [Aspergillus transmontanensis]|uniref:Uncharacterized protein n=1 Tax=Aspergillus transmontanensis TaxID=1034304 RepID=A0A5N6VVQ1_9EURO|nr:hypothetical protein BDV41DRAFT_540865 [Aspergillus transmontanensis]
MDNRAEVINCFLYSTPPPLLSFVSLQSLISACPLLDKMRIKKAISLYIRLIMIFSLRVLKCMYRTGVIWTGRIPSHSSYIRHMSTDIRQIPIEWQQTKRSLCVVLFYFFLSHFLWQVQT